MKSEINVHVTEFASEMSEITGLRIDGSAIYPVSQGWYYYIQPPKAGAPMLLNSYKGGGMAIILMSPEDFKSIEDEVSSPTEYIKTANWQVGYFWGGGNMITGGYYQPMDIIGKNDEFRRYFKILHCRGHYRSCGYMPTEKNCQECAVESCPFSKFKEGDWKVETQEPDPRMDLFEALLKRFESEFPGYTFKGFTCGSTIPDEEVWLEPNGRYTSEEQTSFRVAVSENVIRSLLMHELEIADWEEYAGTFKFQIYIWKYLKDHVETSKFDLTEEALRKVREDTDYSKKEEKVSSKADNKPQEVRITFWEKVGSFFRRANH